MRSINVGDVVKVQTSKKDGSLISFTDLGKIIFFKNKKELHFGYVEITSVEEHEKYILATGNNITFDFYGSTMTQNAIPYKELSELLISLGFRHQYTTPIDEINNFYVWANLITGVLITIEEYNCDGFVGYNSVNVYVAGKLNLSYKELTNYGVVSQVGELTEFILCFSKLKFPLKQILKFAKSKDWDGHTPQLWHYNDIKNMSPVEFKNVMMRIFEFKDNINVLFNIRAEEYIKRLDRL